jgi:hypothetical protein
LRVAVADVGFIFAVRRCNKRRRLRHFPRAYSRYTEVIEAATVPMLNLVAPGTPQAQLPQEVNDRDWHDPVRADLRPGGRVTP